MKKKLSMLSLLGAAAILIVGAVILSSCEGPEGPPGTDGTDGVDGVDGQDGQDANSTCILCHSDDQVIVTKSKQYANSGHNTGHTSGYTNRSFGPSYDCAGCHTSQGFLAALAAGSSSPPYADITQPNCYTCHSIHDTYTEADWALTNSSATVPFTNDVYDSPAVDLGSGNQCSRCHQFAAQYLAVDSLFAGYDDATPTTTVTIPADNSLKRVGVHHAPQYNIVANMDLFEFTGDATYPTDNHITMNAANGCVTCHMNDGFGDLTGHSMAMTYDWHGEENYHWSAECTSCHDGSTAEELDDKVETLMPEIEGLLDDLYGILTTVGVLGDEFDVDATGGSMQYYLMPGVWTTNLVAAVVNYNTIREDKSLGFHNPDYIRATLENTIAAVE